jgi:hypothetical protein
MKTSALFKSILRCKTHTDMSNRAVWTKKSMYKRRAEKALKRESNEQSKAKGRVRGNHTAAAVTRTAAGGTKIGVPSLMRDGK